MLVDAAHRKRICPALDDTMTNSLEQISGEPLDHPVLSLYFPTLQTLRKYLAGALVTESRRALKRLNAVDSALDLDLCSLLDSTIVGVSEYKESPCDIESDIAGATQCTSSGGCQPEISQPEVSHWFLGLLLAIHIDVRELTNSPGCRPCPANIVPPFILRSKRFQNCGVPR
jgi:hypothetical protein